MYLYQFFFLFFIPYKRTKSILMPELNETETEIFNITQQLTSCFLNSWPFVLRHKLDMEYHEICLEYQA